MTEITPIEKKVKLLMLSIEQITNSKNVKREHLLMFAGAIQQPELDKVIDRMIEEGILYIPFKDYVRIV